MDQIWIRGLSFVSLSNREDLLLRLIFDWNKEIIFAFSTHVTREWFLLHGAPASVVVFGVLGGSGLLLLTWQNFMGNHRTLVSMKWPKIALYTLIFTAQIYFWFIGLSKLKSTRTVMLTQYADLWSMSFVAYFVGNNSSSNSTSTSRGVHFIISTVVLSFIADLETPTKSTILLAQDTDNFRKKGFHENSPIKNLIIG
ncbi:14700_t:CDS:2, partial [Acaulospora morrowiae]